MISRFLHAAALGALLFSVQPATAQDRDAEAGLEALIPDSALDKPESWAKSEAPAAGPAQSVTGLPPEPLDASAVPLAEEDYALPWPEEGLELPLLTGLEPDADADGDTLFALEEQAVATAASLADGDATRISSRITLVFSPSGAAFPQRKQFEALFRRLSAIENFAGEGDESIAQLAARARSDRELLRRMLRVFGYYDADVTQTVGGIDPVAGDAGQERAGGKAVVRFDVVPGTPYRFGAIDLARLEDTGGDAAALRAAIGIQPGEQLDSNRIVAGRAGLDAALGESGYPFARLGEPELEIDHSREEGDLTLPVTPGGKYVFGRVTSSLPHFLSGHHLEDIARFEPGDLYRRSLSEDLRRAILATGLVSSVTVTQRETRAPAAGQPGEVTVDVAMTEGPLRTIAGALGYDSAEGPRAELSWEHHNLFPPEGKLRLRAIVGTKEQLGGVTFRRNNFHGRDQVLTVDAYAVTVDRDAYNARTAGLSASFEKLTTLVFQKPWTWSAGAEFLATDEREGDVNGVQTARTMYYIAALPLRLAFDGSDNLLDPTRGLRAALKVEPEVSFQKADETNVYVRIQADASYYQQLGKAVVLAARTRLGSIPGTSIENIAPSRRFFAGGGGSVRGYGYQEIGPRDSLGEPSGGRSLSEFSLEARVATGMFDGALSIVSFVDAGAVDQSSTPSLHDIRYGAGIGVRYKTGFGPIRVDVGVPLNRRPGDSHFGLYVSLGQAF